ncbi:hypothetical protein LINPERPRIM_LOCUS29902 [Linum perenne]
MSYWDDLVFIFWNELATGGDAVQPADAASMVQTRVGLSESVGAEGEQVDSYSIPSNVDHNEVMEHLLNQGDLAVRRQYLYQELATFADLTFGQRTRIMRHLNRDDGDATTYFQLPTSEEKLAFVRNFLQ